MATRTTEALPGGHRLEPGNVLMGKYRVERILGEGGMGIVVAARHLHLDDLVAIKFLLPELVREPEVVARFQREARAAVRIKNEHVVRVFDVAILDTGEPCMVMEYLEGQNLAERLADQGALPIEQAVEFLLHAVEAIAEAHSLGIVHRDVKPANLFLVTHPDGTESVKVLDFGISKATKNLGSGPNLSLTRTRSSMGSPLYMSPEQIASPRDVDARADIWALGVTLFELLTGQPPFQGETLFETQTKIVTHPAPSLCELRPEAPAALQAVVDRCLQKKAEDRYASVGELAVALGDFGPGRARHSVERVSRLLQVGAPSSTERESAARLSEAGAAGPAVPGRSARVRTEGTWGQTARPPSPKRTALVGAAVAASVVFLTLALVGWWILGGRRAAVSVDSSAPPVVAAPIRQSDAKPAQSAELAVAAAPAAALASSSSQISIAPPRGARSIKVAPPGPLRDKGAPSPAPAGSRAPAAPSAAPVDLYGDRR
jgi:serine/threonine-protein kinase